ncbi:unnamed protein product, partial [Laminaria digitata]
MSTSTRDTGTAAVHWRGSKALARLYSTVEAAEQEKGRVSPPRRVLSPSSKRRVKRAIRRRARRLARVRRKNKSKQDALARAATCIHNDDVATAASILNDDGAPVANSTYFPPRWDRRARRRAAALAEQQATTAEAQATTEAGEEQEEEEEEESTMEAVAAVSSVTDEDALETLQSGSASANPLSPTTLASEAEKGRRSKHSIIRGRRMKGGKDRGLWRSVFGPKPLLEVRSVDELSRLVDEEEWGLEDLSVLTWRAESASLGEPSEGVVAVESGDDVGAASDVVGVGVGLG